MTKKKGVCVYERNIAKTHRERMCWGRKRGRNVRRGMIKQM